jgi:hypothetical protein
MLKVSAVGIDPPDGDTWVDVVVEVSFTHERF